MDPEEPAPRRTLGGLFGLRGTAPAAPVRHEKKKSLYEVTGLSRAEMNRERGAATPWMPSLSELAASSACPEASNPPVLGGPGISRLSSFLSRTPQLQPQDTQHGLCAMKSAESPTAFTQAGTHAAALPGVSLPQVTGTAVSSTPSALGPAASQPSGSAGHRSGLPSYKMRLLGLQDAPLGRVPLGSILGGDEDGQGAPQAPPSFGIQGPDYDGADLLGLGRPRGSQPAGGSSSSGAAEPGGQLQRFQAQACPAQRAGAPEPAVAGSGHDPGRGGAAMAMPTMMALAAAGPPSEPLLLEAGGLRLRVPASINCHLREYQRDGVRFLFRQFSQGKGGILADDMGLGKTIQSIAFIAALLGKHGDERDLASGSEAQPPSSPASAAPLLPLLVVCPTSIVDNWLREFACWGCFKVLKLQGGREVRLLEEALEDACTAARQRRVEVVMCTYDKLRLHVSLLASVPWKAAIFDECHRLKDPSSQTYRAARQLGPAPRYGLSGTTMQNKFEELHACLDWACPGGLGARGDFMSYYARPIKAGQSLKAGSSARQLADKRRLRLASSLRGLMLRRTKDIIADQLPKKVDSVVFCDLTPLQRASSRRKIPAQTALPPPSLAPRPHSPQRRCYQRVLACPDLQLLMRPEWPCSCGSGQQRASCCHPPSQRPRMEQGVLWHQLHCCSCEDAYHPLTNPQGCRRHRPEGCSQYWQDMAAESGAPAEGRPSDCPGACLTLPVLTLLRKISNHLDLVRVHDRQWYEKRVAGLGRLKEAGRRDAISRAMQRDLEVARLVLGDDAEMAGGLMLTQSMSSMSDAQHCAKMQVLQTLLRRWHSLGDKVLIFSFSVRVLDCIEEMMLAHGYVTERLDGSTPPDQRQQRVNDFNNSRGVFAFLISTTAGGLGLNLTSANRVVIFDPSWNPAHDLQAQDRAFRLGQHRDVHVYRLLGGGTLEELIYSRQLYKQQQSNMAVHGTRERRYFEGVQGVKGQEGELFGLINLLNFTGTTSKVLSAGDAKRQQAGAGSSVDADREVPSGNAPSSCVSFDIQLFEAAASEDGQEDADGSAVARAVDVLADADGDRPLSEVLVPGSPLEGARGSRQAAAAGASPGQSAAGEKRERAGQSQRPEDQQHVGGRAEADAALSDLAGTGIIRQVLAHDVLLRPSGSSTTGEDVCSGQSGGEDPGDSPVPRGTKGGATSRVRDKGHGGAGDTPNIFAATASKPGFGPTQEAPRGSLVASRLHGRRRPTQLSGGNQPEWTVGEALRGMEVALAGVGGGACFDGGEKSGGEDMASSSGSEEDNGAGLAGLGSKRRRLGMQPSFEQRPSVPEDPEAHALLLQLATTRGWTLLRTARTLMGLKPENRAEMVARLLPPPLASAPKD